MRRIEPELPRRAGFLQCSNHSVAGNVHCFVCLFNSCFSFKIVIYIFGRFSRSYQIITLFIKKTKIKQIRDNADETCMLELDFFISFESFIEEILNIVHIFYIFNKSTLRKWKQLKRFNLHDVKIFFSLLLFARADPFLQLM